MQPEPDVSPQEVQFGDNRSPSFLSNEQTVRGSSSTGPAAKRRRWRARSSSPVSVTPVVPGVYDCLFVCFSNGGTCLFDIVHSALWGSKYPVYTPDTQVLFLSGARMLHTQHSAVQAHPVLL
jgi:hypothetical protein